MIDDNVVEISGNTFLDAGLFVAGNSEVSGTQLVAGSITANSALTVKGALDAQDTLTARGESFFRARVQVGDEAAPGVLEVHNAAAQRRIRIASDGGIGMYKTVIIDGQPEEVLVLTIAGDLIQIYDSGVSMAMGGAGKDLLLRDGDVLVCNGDILLDGQWLSARLDAIEAALP